jgi:hypothetical protein
LINQDISSDKYLEDYQPLMPGKIVRDDELIMSPVEKELLRELAAKVASLSQRQIEFEKRELWRKHNGENSWCEVISEDTIRKGIRVDLDATKGCHVEILMKDTSTVRHDPQRLVRWVEIVRDEI